MPKRKHKKRKHGSGKPRRSQTSPKSQVVPKPRVDQAPTGPVILILPSAEIPLLRLEIDRQATPEQRELARRYWMPKPDGGWSEPVANFGQAWHIASELKKVCTAYLLNMLCSTCESPMSVINRSDAVARGGHDLRRSDMQ